LNNEHHPLRRLSPFRRLSQSHRLNQLSQRFRSPYYSSFLRRLLLWTVSLALGLSLGLSGLGRDRLDQPSWSQEDPPPDASTVLQALPQNPDTCRMGVYITDLRSFDLGEQSFTADFEVWSVCPRADLKPLESFTLLNAVSWSKGNSSTLEVANQSDSFTSREVLYWSRTEISATFFYNWNLRNYPFDRQVLTIGIQESTQDVESFIYTPDFEQSGYPRSLRFSDWEITDFRIQESPVIYDTTLGNPLIQEGKGAYSALKVSVELQRTNLISFLKLTAGVYAAVALSAMTLLLGEDHSDRLGILVGTLFAAVVNLQVASDSLGQDGEFGLMDSIHVLSILYIFSAACISLYSRHLSEIGKEKRALWLDRQLSLPIFCISFTILNIILISYAAIVG